MFTWKREKYREIRRQHLAGEHIYDFNRDGFNRKATVTYVCKLWQEMQPKNPRKDTFCSSFRLFSREQEAKGVKVEGEKIRYEAKYLKLW
jgi:hypothetical protein